MSGTDIIGALLLADTAVLAKVPAAQIKSGRLPDNVVLPALLVRSVSTVERKTLKRTGAVRVTERVAVAVRAASYRDAKAIIKLVKTACAGATGLIAGAQSVAVTAAGTGPDLLGPADTFERTQDFTVGFDEPA